MPQLDIFTFFPQYAWSSAMFWFFFVCLFVLFIIPFAYIAKLFNYTSISIISEQLDQDNIFADKNAWSGIELVTNTLNMVDSLNNQILDIMKKDSKETVRETRDNLLTDTDYSVAVFVACSNIIGSHSDLGIID